MPHVFPAESCGIRRSEKWQKHLPNFTFRWWHIPAESWHSGTETRMIPGMHRNGLQPESGDWSDIFNNNIQISKNK